MRTPHAAGPARRRFPTPAGCIALVLACAATPRAAAADTPLPFTVDIFQAYPLRFVPDVEIPFDTADATSAEHGRVGIRSVVLPELTGAVKITAHVRVSPVAKDELEVFDKWDRAGNVRLVVEGAPDLEIVKFITPYGGATEYEADVSHLAPLLAGACTFRAFIDTWVSPAWDISFALSYSAAADTLRPVWCSPLSYVESATADRMEAGGIQAEVEVPPGLKRVMLYYYVSGHCTDGRDADEFESKDNVIYVDGQVVFRYRPWRDDCRDFRELNPYCRRWSDGSWSCDYARSGWCPGDRVAPLVLDLSDHFSEGSHRVRLQIERIRPKGSDGHYGYWRVSAHLVGYR